jgi:hypothetical protein
VFGRAIGDGRTDNPMSCVPYRNLTVAKRPVHSLATAKVPTPDAVPRLPAFGLVLKGSEMRPEESSGYLVPLRPLGNWTEAE